MSTIIKIRNFLLTNRFLLLALDLCVIVISLGLIDDAVDLLKDPSEQAREVIYLSEFIGTLFVTYGVALEERRALLKFTGVYPKHHNKFQARLDDVCHKDGLYLLLTGLFLKIVLQIIQVPSRFLSDYSQMLYNRDTGVSETTVFIITLICGVLGVCFILQHMFLMFSKVKVLSRS